MTYVNYFNKMNVFTSMKKALYNLPGFLLDTDRDLDETEPNAYKRDILYASRVLLDTSKHALDEKEVAFKRIGHFAYTGRFSKLHGLINLK